MNILITGGAGYIGSHTALELAQSGHQISIVDNLSNSKLDSIERLEKILGISVNFIHGDVRDTNLLIKAIQDNNIDSVIHFAGLKSVSQSAAHPIEYYANNVQGTISLIEAMQVCQVRTLVFSSSATVYGDAVHPPYHEDYFTRPINPYGNTKLQVEAMLTDWSRSDPDVRISILRYFNPIGAHESGLLGEVPSQIPNNLMPYINQVINGTLPHLNIYGKDYETKDGTPERDYIHVMDIAEGHIAAIHFLENHPGLHIHNLGTGRAVTVLELVRAFETSNHVKVPFQFTNRRIGDLPSSYANVDKALKELNWSAKRSIEQACEDAYRFSQLYQ